jgi:tRNA (mo5U34)-methyltransferase
MNASEIEYRIGQLPYWYHKIELPHGITTPGWAPLIEEYYRVPERLDNKRVLDVGAWDGYWTFEAIKRGASQAVAIDDFSDYLGKLPTKNRKAWQNFDTCREILGFSEFQCPRFDMSVYDIRKETFGMFDVVFFFGTLYHLRHPLLALDKLFEVCRNEIYIESAILDDFSPYRGGIGHGYPGGQMVMEFYPEDQYGNNTTNWWIPTLNCMVQMVKAAGFEYVEGWKLDEIPEHLPLCRGFIKGVKRL